MKFKKGLDINQEVLFPKKISDFIPENHPCRMIVDVVSSLDLSSIEDKYSEIGQHAYDPRTMLSLLFYGYSEGERSSRKLSKACENRFDFVFIVKSLKPSHDRISDFRKDNSDEIKEIFAQIVVIGSQMGLVNFGNINNSIDGAKLKASASSKLSKDEDGLNRLLEKTKEQIDDLLQKADSVDIKEDLLYGKNKRGDEIPKKLQSKKSRKAAIEKALKKLQEQKNLAKEKLEKEKGGELTRTEFKKIEKMKMNVTDNDAQFMKERIGVIRPSYNGQISVDETNQFILAFDAVTDCNDQHQLVSIMQQTKENVGEDSVTTKADYGYFPELEDARRLFPDVDLYVDDKNRRKEEINLGELMEKYSQVQLENLEKLLTKKGEAEYKKRMHTVEPVFGNVKFNLGYSYLLLRGTQKANGEFGLMCIAHNLNKIVKCGTKRRSADVAVAVVNIKKRRKNVEKNKNRGQNLEKGQGVLEEFTIAIFWFSDFEDF